MLAIKNYFTRLICLKVVLLSHWIIRILNILHNIDLSVPNENYDGAHFTVDVNDGSMSKKQIVKKKWNQIKRVIFYLDFLFFRFWKFFVINQ